MTDIIKPPKLTIMLDASKIDLETAGRFFIEVQTRTEDSNGCWISDIKPYNDGYVHIKVNQKRYALHRLSLCIFNNLDYHDDKIQTRHSQACSRACFNPEHLKPGSYKDNALDAVKHGTHINAAKDACPKCGGDYRQYRIKSGQRKGSMFRECRDCKNEARRNRWRNR